MESCDSLSAGAQAGETVTDNVTKRSTKGVWEVRGKRSGSSLASEKGGYLPSVVGYTMPFSKW
jgi:hypothetical protein